MGWIGWLPEQALAADVNAVIIAIEGRVEMLNGIFGDPKKAKGKKRPITARTWKAVVKAHNTVMKRRKNG